MKLQTVFVGFALAQSIASFDLDSPACVSKCWDNSKYVSACPMVNERLCLCEDAQFQNVVLQCLYSQCPTSQFGPALHHTLSACSDSTPDTPYVEPPLIRYQSLRKRGTPTTGAASGLVSASAVHSVARRSASASAYQTFSARVNHRVGRRAAAAHTTPSPTSTTLSGPLSSEDIVSSAILPAASAP